MVQIYMRESEKDIKEKSIRIQRILSRNIHQKYYSAAVEQGKHKHCCG